MIGKFSLPRLGHSLIKAPEVPKPEKPYRSSWAKDGGGKTPTRDPYDRYYDKDQALPPSPEKI